MIKIASDLLMVNMIEETKKYLNKGQEYIEFYVVEIILYYKSSTSIVEWDHNYHNIST